MAKGIINVVQTIKSIHPKDIILIKTGTFYNVYLKDAVIISNIFNYKLKKIDIGYNVCGFPTTSINKVRMTLEAKQINYRLINRANNYEEEESENYKSQNNYDQEYEKAVKQIRIKDKIDKINSYLLKNIDEPYINDILTRIEQRINEKR